MSEVKTCPKCGNVMKRGDYLAGYGAARLVKIGDLRGDKVIPFYCENCGYIELYNEKRLRYKP
jgi:predicted nucleic-acid-binding Zn-ribbon protein